MVGERWRVGFKRRGSGLLELKQSLETMKIESALPVNGPRTSEVIFVALFTSAPLRLGQKRLCQRANTAIRLAWLRMFISCACTIS